MRIAILGPASPQQILGCTVIARSNVPVGLGGTPVNLLVQSLVAKGHQVTLISASPDVSETWTYRQDNLELRVVPYRHRARNRALDFFRAERKALEVELMLVDVDIVHAHWSYEFGWPAVFSKKEHVLTVHDAPLTVLRRLPDAYRLVRTIMSYIVRSRARTVTAVSPYLAAQWRKEMRYRRSIEIIPNIVPPLERIESEKSLLHVVDITDASSLKNVTKLLVAFDLFRVRFPESRLRLIGGGLGKDEPMSEWARSRNLDKNVDFLGRQSRDSIQAELNSATIFCHSSLEEAQPMSLLEAMQIGVPVVAGKASGGVPWTLDEGRAGMLVDVSDANSICEGMFRVIDQPKMTKRMVSVAEGLIADRFSDDAVSRAYLELYRTTIQNAVRKH